MDTRRIPSRPKRPATPPQEDEQASSIPVEKFLVHEKLFKLLPTMAVFREDKEHPRDLDQLMDYLIVMYDSMIRRFDYIHEHGSNQGYMSKKYKAPSSRETTNEEALTMFKELRDEQGLYEEGKGGELVTEILEE
jgi:hypothetical protein